MSTNVIAPPTATPEPGPCTCGGGHPADRHGVTALTEQEWRQRLARRRNPSHPALDFNWEHHPANPDSQVRFTVTVTSEFYGRIVTGPVPMAEAMRVVDNVLWFADNVDHGVTVAVTSHDNNDPSVPSVPSTEHGRFVAAARWALAHGWAQTSISQCVASPGGRTEVAWGAAADDRLTVTVMGRPLVDLDVPVTSVRQAMDLLSALGVLPAEMSSAYAAGRASVLGGAA